MRIHFLILALLATLAFTGCGGGGGGGGGGGAPDDETPDTPNPTAVSGIWTFDYALDGLPDQTFQILKDPTLGGDHIIAFGGLEDHAGIEVLASGYVYSTTIDATTVTWTVDAATNTTLTGVYSTSAGPGTTTFTGSKTTTPTAVNDSIIGSYQLFSFGALDSDPTVIITKVGGVYQFQIDGGGPATAITVSDEHVLTAEQPGVRFVFYREDGSSNITGYWIINPTDDDTRETASVIGVRVVDG